MPKKMLRRPRSGTKKSRPDTGAARKAGPDPGPLRVRDVAALCGVEPKTVHNWVARGMIPHFRTPGRHVRFLRDEVAAFVAKGRSNGGGGGGEPSPALAGGGASSVVVVVLPVLQGSLNRTVVPARAGSRVRAALASLRRAFPESRVVWFDGRPSALPAGVEQAATADELRALLGGKAGRTRRRGR